jgi:hypothetical protein
VPARSIALLVAGPRAEPGAAFGGGRLCVAGPIVRLGCARASDEGIAVVRIGAERTPFSGACLQILWRDVWSGQWGATAVARLCPGG